MANVLRAQSVRMTCLNEKAEPQFIEAEGLYARVLQHEIDHLNGVLYIDRIRCVIDDDFPWERLTGEPLISASMGTLQNGLDIVFHQIADAAGTRPGLQLVLSIGSSLNPAQIRSLPANAIVVQKAPQIELLKRAVLCITHAGLSTTLESLTQGVPMVAIPVTNDQPGVAARIAYKKTGAVIPLKEMTVPRLASLIDEVLSKSEIS